MDGPTARAFPPFPRDWHSIHAIDMRSTMRWAAIQCDRHAIDMRSTMRGAALRMRSTVHRHRRARRRRRRGSPRRCPRARPAACVVVVVRGAPAEAAPADDHHHDRQRHGRSRRATQWRASLRRSAIMSPPMSGESACVRERLGPPSPSHERRSRATHRCGRRAPHSDMAVASPTTAGRPPLLLLLRRRRRAGSRRDGVVPLPL